MSSNPVLDHYKVAECNVFLMTRFRRTAHHDRITEIMRGERDVTADTEIRLGRYFRTDPRLWLNLHAAHDIRNRRRRTTTPRPALGDEWRTRCQT